MLILYYDDKFYLQIWISKIICRWNKYLKMFFVLATKIIICNKFKIFVKYTNLFAINSKQIRQINLASLLRL